MMVKLMQPGSVYQENFLLLEELTDESRSGSK